MLDLTNVKSNNNDVLPEGKYSCAVVKAEMADTKSGSGMMIKAEFRIMEGENKGRKIFHNFNVQNQNAKAQEIGLSQLKQLMEAGGFKEFKLKSPQALEGVAVGVKTKIRKDETYGDRAEVSYFFPASKASAKEENLPI